MAEDNNLKEELKLGDSNDESPISLSEVCRFCIFSILFVAILLNQLSTESAYHISAGINQAMMSCDPTIVTSSDDVNNWINSALPAISSKNIYLNWNVSEDKNDYLRVNMMNRIITPLRFVQKRMARVKNTNPRTSSLVSEKWVANELDPYKDNKSNEDKNPFIPEHLKVSDLSVDDYNRENFDMYMYKGDIGVSGSGGFMYKIDFKNDSQISNAIDFFSVTSWIDSATAIVYVDFVTYNSHYSMLTYVNFLFTFTSSGLVQGSSDIRSAHYNKYNPEIDMPRIIFEAIYLLLLVFYTLIEIQEIKMDILSEKVKLKNSLENKKFIGCLMIIEGLKKHFADLWNILDVSSILLSYICLGVWIKISNNNIVKMNSISYDTDTTDKVLGLIMDTSMYIQISSINLLIIFFRLLKYLGRFERIRLLQSTFVRAKTEIFYFFILLIGIFLSFVIFGHVAFGGIYEKFSTVQSSFASCLVILFTDVSAIMDLLLLDFNMTALFIVLFTLFINFILANMFIAIINNAFAVELDNLEIQKKSLKDVEKIHWLYQMKDWCSKIKLSILSKFSKRKEVVSRYADREQQISKLDEDDEIIRAKNYDLDYNEAILWGERYDKEVLTDKEKNAKIKKQTFNFSKRVWKAFIFIIFTVIYTIVLLNQVEIEKKYDLNYTIQNQINNYIDQNGNSLSSIGKYSDFSVWFGEVFSNIFGKSSYYNLQGNYLVGQYITEKDTCATKGPLRMTLRYLKTRENPDSLFREINPIQRKKEFSPFESHFSVSSSEDTKIEKNPSGPSCGVSYIEPGDGGFNDEGGYVYYFSMIYDDYNNQTLDLMENLRFLNETLNSLVIDFVLYNGDLNYFTYSSFIVRTISGGEIYASYYIWPMKLNMYLESGDKVRAAFEVIILLLLAYHIYVTVTMLKNKFRSYDDWSSRFHEILTTKQKEKRRIAKPEILRKISSIITPYEFLDLASYSISIACVIYWFMYICSDLALNFRIPTNDQDFLQKFSAQAILLERYTYLSSFNILLMYFRIMNYVTINKALSFLQDTMTIAMVDILYFLIMLVVILMGFVFMAYLSFGHTLDHYKTISDSFITCFAMMIGEFDYDELLTADSAMTYFFFFFYMLFFSFILLNIFIAILERAYTQVKESLADEENNVTVFESLVIFILSSIKKAFDKNKHVQEHQKDIKELAVCVFNRIDNIVEEEEDPVSWAIKQAEEILLERQKRSEIKAPLDSIFRMRKLNVIEGGNFFFEKEDDLIKEFEARLDYWDYLRIGYLSYQSLEQKIRIKTEELIKKNELLYEEFKEIEQEKEEIMMDIQPVEVTLMKLKKDNEELVKRNKEIDE